MSTEDFGFDDAAAATIRLSDSHAKKNPVNGDGNAILS